MSEAVAYDDQARVRFVGMLLRPQTHQNVKLIFT